MKIRQLVLALSLLCLTSTRSTAQTFTDVQIVSAPDIHNWSQTAHITQVVFEPGNFKVEFDKHSSWPNVVPPGWDGPIQYTLWPIIKVNGQWTTTGAIEFWKDRVGVGGPFSDGANNWWSKMPPMSGVQPGPGERVGFMVVAGDQRLKDVRSVEERSDIAWVTVPANDTGTFNFSAPVPTPTSDPTPAPAPAPTPAPAPAFDPTPILARLAAIEQAVARLDQNSDVSNHAVIVLQAQVAALEADVEALKARPVLAQCRASAFGIALSCKLVP
jgi:hypothetical protein